MSLQLVSAYTPGADRNNLTGSAGVRFTLTAGHTYTVTQLGLRKATGNSGNSTARISDPTSGATLTSAAISLTAATVGQFVYGAVSIKLIGGVPYQITRDVTNTGQNWSDTGVVSLTDAGSVSAVSGASLGSLTVGTANQMFAGVDMTFTVDDELALSDIDGYVVMTPGLALSEFDGYVVMTPGLSLAEFDGYVVMLMPPVPIAKTFPHVVHHKARKMPRPTTLRQLRARYKSSFPIQVPHRIRHAARKMARPRAIVLVRRHFNAGGGPRAIAIFMA